jgi:hypothetical protein
MIKLKCLFCYSNLTGKKIKYCSKNCENKYKVEKNKMNRHKEKALKPKIKCLVCKTFIPEGKRKFCSANCACKYKNREDNGASSYKNQLKRAKERKLILINMLGGSCESCGYCKNYSALAFHHKDPKNKKFNIDSRQCSNRSCKTLLEEVAKCSLLCMNCHMELHHPQCSIGPAGNRTLSAEL